MEYSDYLAHVGKGHKDGGKSGRYPWGTGKKWEQKELAKKVKQDRQKAVSDRAKRMGDAAKDVKSMAENLGTGIDSLWNPKAKNSGIYKLRTEKIESINRRNRAIDEYNRAHPTPAQKAKERTLNVIKGVGSLTLAAMSAAVVYDRFKNTDIGHKGKELALRAMKAIPQSVKDWKSNFSRIGNFTM